MLKRLAAVNTNLNSENALLLKWKIEGIPDGMVLVPRDPTEARLNAVEKEWHELTAHTFGDFYRVMIVAGEIK